MKRAVRLHALLLMSVVLGALPSARGEPLNPSPAAGSAAKPPAPSSGRTSATQAPENAGQNAASGKPNSSAPPTAGAATGQSSPNSPPGPASTNPASGRAQTKPPAPQRLPTLVVTATRIEEPIADVGTTVTVLSGHQVEAQKIDQVGDALREVPGVEVNRSGSPGTLTDVGIRGSTPAQTLVMVDGVEVNTAASGAFDLATLTTDNLDRIEVVRGAGGALYGSQAIGGVINIISKEGEGAPHFSLLSEGGNRATERQLLTFNGAEGELGYSGALSYFSTTGFRPINDSFDNLSGALRLDYHLTDDTVLRGFARYIRSNVSLVNFSNFVEPIDPDAHQRNEFMLFKGELEHRFNDHLTVRWDASFVRNEIRLNDHPDPGNPVLESDDIPDETRATTVEAIYGWIPGFRTLVGFDLKDRWARSGDHFTGFGSETITVFHHQRQEYAGYFEQEGSFLSGLVLATGGLRADGNSDFGMEVSPAWALAIPIEPLGVTARGSYSEGFRAPSFDELFFPNFGNPNLQPELSSEYDGGFTKSFGESATFTATYFSRRVHRLIVPVPCPTCLFGTSAGNVGRVDVQGVELAPSIRFWPDLRLTGNFTFLDESHQPVLVQSLRPQRVPKRAAAAVLSYQRAEMFRFSDRINANLAYTFFGDRDDLDPVLNRIRSHVGYHKFDAVVSYAPGIRFGAVANEEVYVRVQNLADRNYSENFGFKSPPINFVVGVKLDLETAAGGGGPAPQ